MSDQRKWEPIVLQRLATQVRLDALEMTVRADSGHLGGSMSVADLLTVLYFYEMNVNPKDPHMEGRDRLVLSKGHCTPALYATLALAGFFDRALLDSFRQHDSILSGHAEMHVPGVEMSTGSLGQGLSAAVGMALAGKIDEKDYRVFAIMGDGEIQEGQIWEAAMSAAQFKLDNLTAIVDNNDLQIDGHVGEIMSVYPIAEKFRAFGWSVDEIDGHDFNAIRDALEHAKEKAGKPHCIVMKTIKGKGISYMENVCKWHGETPNAEEFEVGRNELLTQLRKLEAEHD